MSCRRKYTCTGTLNRHCAAVAVEYLSSGPACSVAEGP